MLNPITIVEEQIVLTQHTAENGYRCSDLTCICHSEPEQEFTREQIIAWFGHIVRNDTASHRIIGVYRLTDIGAPAWIIFDQTVGIVTQMPLEVAHVVVVRNGKLSMCATEEVK